MRRKKKLTTGQKLLIGAGAALGIGLLISATTPKKTDTYLPPVNPSPTPQPDTTPQPQPQPQPQPEPTSNYDLLKGYMNKTGVPVTQYTDRLELQMNYNGLPRKFQFWNNGRFMFYWRDAAGSWKTSTKGNYTNGGRVLTITDGTKAGQIKNGTDVLLNIKNAL